MIDLAKALREEVTQAALRFKQLSDAQASADRGLAKWVNKETLGHLIDSAANNHQRFVRAQFTIPFVWPGYEQTSWVTLHRYRERPWAELVELWVALNRHVAAVIESVPADKLSTPCTIGDHQPEPLEWWMRDYLRHLKHHIEQLAA
jgi:hypothetical protein